MNERNYRQDLIKRMLTHGLDNLSKVIALRQEVTEWLRLHPDDEEILSNGESLYMLEEALKDA